MKLEEVCDLFLDNADMRIDFSAYPNVKFDMFVFGTINNKYWKVVFECGQVVQMDAEFDDDALPNDLFLVLEAKVNQIPKEKVANELQERINGLTNNDLVWRIFLYGDMSVTLFTTKFDWQLIELSLEEYEATRT